MKKQCSFAEHCWTVIFFIIISWIKSIHKYSKVEKAPEQPELGVCWFHHILEPIFIYIAELCLSQSEKRLLHNADHFWYVQRILLNGIYYKERCYIFYPSTVCITSSGAEYPSTLPCRFELVEYRMLLFPIPNLNLEKDNKLPFQGELQERKKRFLACGLYVSNFLGPSLCPP